MKPVCRSFTWDVFFQALNDRIFYLTARVPLAGFPRGSTPLSRGRRCLDAFHPRSFWGVTLVPSGVSMSLAFTSLPHPLTIVDGEHLWCLLSSLLASICILRYEWYGSSLFSTAEILCSGVTFPSRKTYDVLHSATHFRLVLPPFKTTFQ